MKILHEVLICVLLAVLIVGAVFAVLFVRDSSKSAKASNETMAMLNAALKGKRQNGDDGLLALSRVFLQNADGAANALKQTLQDTNRIAKAQEKKTGALADSSIALVKSGGAAVVKLGDSLNTLDGVIGDVRTTMLPKLDAGIDSLNGLVSDLRPTAKASTELLTATTGDMQALHGTIDLANTKLADPDIAATIHSLKLMADTGVDTMHHVDGAVIKTEHLAGEFDDMFKPPPKATFFEQLAITAAKNMFGPIAGSLISHIWPTRVEVVR